MKALLTIAALAGAIALADAAVEQWTGGNTAIARSRSSTSSPTCPNVRRGSRPGAGSPAKASVKRG
jgi:hypothetical protein